MWPNVIPATSWGLVWILAVTVAFIHVSNNRTNRRFAQWLIYFGKRPLPLLLLFTLLPRLIPILLLPVGAAYDIESFQIVGDALLNGQEVYAAAKGRHPYLPFQMGWIGIAAQAARLTLIPFVIWIKLLPLLADVGIAALIYQASESRTGMARTAINHGASSGQHVRQRPSGTKSAPEGRRSLAPSFTAVRHTAVTHTLLFALNPISILITAYHGQFDSITLYLLLLAWTFTHFGQRHNYSALALGLAVLSKTWPIVFLPIVWLRLRDNKERGLYTAVTLAVPILAVWGYVTLFKTDPYAVLLRPLTHTGNPGYWGPSAIFAVIAKSSPVFQTIFQTHVSLRRWLLLLVGLAALWRTRRETAVSALTTIILCEFAVTVGLGIQWLVWVIPFALVAGETRWTTRYSLACLLLLLAQLYGIHLYPWGETILGVTTSDIMIRLASLPAWWVTITWAIRRLRYAT